MAKRVEVRLGAGPIPFLDIRSTLTANTNLDERPQLLNHLIQRMLDSFAEKSEQLKKAKPIPVAVTPG